MDTKSKNEIPETTKAIPAESTEKLLSTGIASVQGDTKSKPEWINKGIIDVPVNDLPEPEGVKSPADFNHNISWEDAQAVTQKLPEIQVQVNAGKTGEDFSAMDQANGLDPQNGTRRIYDLYYGTRCIKVDKIGDEYFIDGGNHRIFAAKAAGLKTIPARVKEKVGS